MVALSLTNGQLLFLTCVVAQTMEKLASVSVKSMEKLRDTKHGVLALHNHMVRCDAILTHR
jgi:hypothetical protein